MMLVSESFQIVEGYKPFHFKCLKLVSQQPLCDIYENSERNQQIIVLTTPNLHLLSKLRCLQSNHFISPIVGYLRKGNSFYVFSKLIDQEYTLQSYVERLKEKKANPPYLSFAETERLLSFLVRSIEVFQGEGITYLTVLEPSMIVVEHGEKDKTLKFKYGIPLDEPIMVDREMNRALMAMYKDKLEFSAPEMVKYCCCELNTEHAYQRTGKEAIYSIGLVVFYAVFGVIFTKEERLNSLSDKKEFESQIKSKRKIIKSCFDEKNISKILKLLLERDAVMRDGISTLKIKMASRQFHQKKVEQPEASPTAPEHVPTVEELDNSQHSHHSEGVKRSQVQLNLSKNAVSEIMKASKNTQVSSAIYQKGTEVKEPKDESVEFRVANSIEDVEEEREAEMTYENAHEQTMNEKLVKVKEEQYLHNPDPLANRKSEATLANLQWRQSSVGSSLGVAYPQRVEDELRKFKFCSVLILLVSVSLATLLAVYQHAIV